MARWLTVLPPKPGVLCLLPMAHTIEGGLKVKSKNKYFQDTYILTTLESRFSLKSVIIVNKIHVTLKLRRQISFLLLYNKLPQQ